MKHAIEQRTDHFIAQLPEDNEQYEVKNLSQYGFPAFLIQTIEINLKNRISEDFANARWFNDNDKEIQQTRQAFLNAAHNRLRFPAEAAGQIINEAVETVVKILVQPRENIPNILFEGEENISAQDVGKKIEIITVYQHFGMVLTGYMNRKNREELTKKQCSNIIANVDKRLTEGHTPRQWAQLLDPLFVLFNDSVSPDLLKLFFEEKKMEQYAQLFESAEEAITRSQLIEMLSSPKPERDVREPDQPELFSKSEKRIDLEQFTPPPPETYTVETENRSYGANDNGIDTEVEAEKAPGENIANEEPELKKETAEKPQPNINKLHSAAKKTESERRSLNELFYADAKGDDAEKESSKSIAAGFNDSNAKTAELPSPSPDDNKETPIWQRYIDGNAFENKPVNPAEPLSDEHEATPVFHQNQSLEVYLKDQEGYFVEALFSGSKSSYKKFLSETARQTQWSEVGSLIKNDIFNKYSVDMYSEAAVEFTDRLQNWFTENKSRN